MKLRTRLFLWVGILFALAFGISLILETFTTDRSLRDAEKVVRQKILDLSEDRRKHVEEFLHVSLSEDQALIDSLLLRLSRDKSFGAALFLDPQNLDRIAPAHSAYLYKDDQWIDFIQTTKENRLTSMLIPIDFPMMTAHSIKIDEHLSWVLMDKDRGVDRPLMGVKLSTNPRTKTSLAVSVDEMIEVDWGLTILFDPKYLETWTRKPMGELSLLEEIDFSRFLDSVDRAATYLKEHKGLDAIKKDINQKSGGNPFSEMPFDLGVRCLQEEGEVLNNRIIQLLQRGDQAIMLSSLASIFAGGEFGGTPLSEESPVGIGRFAQGAKAGYLVLTDEVFFEKKLFDDSGFYSTHPSSKDCPDIGGSIAVIAPKNMDRVFVGNILKLEGNPSSGFLTLGIDVDTLVQDLVLSIHQDAFLVHSGKIISAFTAEGNEIQNPSQSIPFTEEMLKSKSGVIKREGKDYYYLHMVPFKNLDLHFFILELEKDAFALVNSLDQGTREVIRNVSYSMRLIAVIALAFVLFLLNRVAKKITKPITALAAVTEDVASGKLEGIEIPRVKEGRHDEIETLCHSFAKMVTGLKEREKVKGVLNKVVSPEIAAEITKGTIHLGGEERKVTVFFADIRNFTGMSAQMKPQEVIAMLNDCMTRVSHVIDEFGGVIDKYVGDEVMALFGAPLEKEDSALKAVQCGLQILEVLRKWNGERKSQQLDPIEMGIGIHTGTMIIGNMGAENRLNYTVLGNNVNFASRLCSNAKPMEILISKETLAEPHVGENIEVEESEKMELKGYEEPFTVYRVQGGKGAS